MLCPGCHDCAAQLEQKCEIVWQDGLLIELRSMLTCLDHI